MWHVVNPVRRIRKHLTNNENGKKRKRCDFQSHASSQAKFLEPFGTNFNMMQCDILNLMSNEKVVYLFSFSHLTWFYFHDNVCYFPDSAGNLNAGFFHLIRKIV